MDSKILKKSNIEEGEIPLLAETLNLSSCQQKFNLKPEDEISLDSIFSALLDQIEPPEKEFGHLNRNLTAKDLLNAKQAILFEESLYISKLRDNNCKLSEKTKIFLESNLEEIGEFKLNVKECYDGYEVFAKSKMLKDKAKFTCGHCLRGKYDDKFNLICEKRREYDYVDKARIEKSLDARVFEDKILFKRETNINQDTQQFKAVINVKGRDNILILDGGVMLLMRYLIVNNFRGDFQYFSININGKILRCQLTVYEERQEINIFHRTFKNSIHVVNTQYFNDQPKEVSKTFFCENGKMILHYWHDINCILHEPKGYVELQESVLPKLELQWRNHNLLLDQYRSKKKLTYENARAYFEKHPELMDILQDYIINVLKHKPNNVLEFTLKHFQKFEKPIPMG